MACKKEKVCISLDEQSYTVLKQKASFSNTSMNKYLTTLAMEVQFLSLNIVIHDLTELNTNLSELVTGIEHFYKSIAKAEEDGSGNLNDVYMRIVQQFARLGEVLERKYMENDGYRKERVNIEKAKMRNLIRKAQKSCSRDMDISFLSPQYYTLLLYLTDEERRKVLLRMKESGMIGVELSAYMRKLINSRYFIQLTKECNDVNDMVQFIYPAKAIVKTLIRTMTRQGKEYESQVREMESLYDKVNHYERELWIMIMNDRQMLYKYFSQKIYEPDYFMAVSQSMGSGVNRKRREKGLWQSQE